MSAPEAALGKALEIAAKEAGEGAAAWLLGALAGPIAAPAARVAGAAVGALAAALAAQSSALEEKLDELLKEPWRTGSREVVEALALPAATGDERRVREARLQAGLSKLDSARSLAAEKGDAGAARAARALQALGWAAIPGGGPSAERCLRELEARAAELRRLAAEADEYAVAPRPRWKPPPTAGAAFLRTFAEAGAPPGRYEFLEPPTAGETAASREEAERLRSAAAAAERFCAVVRALARGTA